MNKGLWIAQGLLALLFLFTGLTKLVMPMAMITAQMPVPLPALFIRFLGGVEILGAIGLILPGLLHIRPGLTPLAAAGLLAIMVGATAYTVAFEGVLAALLPLITGLLTLVVAYGRWRLAPLPARSRDTALRPSVAQR